MILDHMVLHDTLVSVGRLLRLQAPTTSSHTALCIIHSFLKRSILPAEDIVAVLSVPGVVAGTQVEGLRAVGGPVGLVVELSGIPNDLSSVSITRGWGLVTYLEHDLWNLDRVC